MSSYSWKAIPTNCSSRPWSNTTGGSGFDKLSGLYAKARRTYQKGYATRDLIRALDMGKIAKKRSDVLTALEKALRTDRHEQ